MPFHDVKHGLREFSNWDKMGIHTPVWKNVLGGLILFAVLLGIFQSNLNIHQYPMSHSSNEFKHNSADSVVGTASNNSQISPHVGVTPSSEGLEHGSVTEMRWVNQSDDDNEIYLLSAFWDDRWPEVTKPSITVLAMVLSTRDVIHAIIVCSDNPEPEFHHQRLSLIKQHRPVFDKLYLRIFLNVPVECTKPKKISLTFNENVKSVDGLQFVPVEYPSKSLIHNFTICVPPMFGCLDAERMVEWIEMQKILGVSHIVIHNFTQCETTSKVLREYAKQGLIHIRLDHALFATNKNGPFSNANKVTPNAEISPRMEIRMRTMSMLTDCMYRHMHDSRYVVSLDIDEVIVPTKSYSLYEMMKEVETTYSNVSHVSEYTFHSYMFLTNKGAEVTSPVVGKLVDDAYPNSTTYLQYRIRLQESRGYGRRKSIIPPLNCHCMHNHECISDISNLKPEVVHQDSVMVDSAIGKVHHYRDNACKIRRSTGRLVCENNTPLTPVYHDDNILRYKDLLLKNLKTAHHFNT